MCQLLFWQQNKIDIIEDTNADFENSDESENLIVTSDGENFEIVDESAELDLPMENTENLNSTEDDSIELFDDGNNISEFVGNESETNDWIQSEQVEGLSFKYDVNNQTLYLKSEKPVVLPDYKQSGWTSEWQQ